MKKTLLAALTIALAVSGASAQVANRALKFESTGSVDCGQLPTLNELSSYTLQFWVNPSQWTPDATIVSRGSDFSAKLGTEGSVVFTVGTTSLVAPSADLKTGEWSQLTFIVNNGAATALVNGAQVITGTLPSIPKAETSLKLGGNFIGMIDEVRIWNDILSDEFDYFTNNTLNQFNSQWDNLLVYYKMDQTDCENLVDYHGIHVKDAAYNNHGVLTDGVTRVDANNPKMPYLWNAAYTENVRFYDRIIPRAEYLMSNAIIILGADAIPETGGIKTRTPNYHAISFKNAPYMAEYQGREGVVALDGDGYIQCPNGSFTSYNGEPLSTYTFETWIYLEEWSEGAYIVRKENDTKTEGIAICLGSGEDKRIVVRIDGKEYVSMPTDLSVGKWNHFAVTPGNRSIPVNSLYIYVNGTKPSYCIDPTLSATDPAGVPTVSDKLNCLLGEGLHAKLDETCIWQKTFAGGDIKSQMTQIPIPALNKNVLQVDMENVNTYYRYDNPDWLGFSSHSQDNWMFIMKGAYDGYDGAKMYISVNGKYGDPPAWATICNTASKRQVFAKACAELVELYDGLELDLEWLSNWTNYSMMADSIVKYLPEGKEFRISTHNSYYSYPKAKITNPKITGFTFQQYGPQAVHFGYQNFVNNITNFENYGYPKDKIVSSYSTTTSRSSLGAEPTGIRTLMPNYVPNPNANVETQNNFTFMGPYQVYKRAKYTREKNLQGIFYWDMGNDYWEGTAAAPILPKYNYARYCSYGLNANVDSIVTKVVVNHYNSSGIVDVSIPSPDGSKITISPSPVQNDAYITIGGEAASKVTIYSLAGAAVIQTESNHINVSSLQNGVYIVQAISSSGKQGQGKFTKI